MFSAGTDTTFTTLEWTLSELIKHPPAMKKLQQEATIIAEGRSTILEQDLEKMQYLKAVVKESMRLHTPVPLIPRETTEGVELMGYDIPVGTQVLVNVWAIGRDPTVWEDSNKFRPERFLDNSTEYKSLHYDWLPFGAGRRGCPGIQFATTIIELALANMVHKFDFELPNGVKNEDIDMSETYGITVHKKSSLITGGCESAILVVAHKRY
ncbi:unnamed protein product [Lactuca saligna]|uniref:Cytochrome P450 n=1 Tax=Lactuca saligna TaxID=75948 RepID=A0AA35V1F6_LACSI|nr:unnamed protein product [Lactuca saligna]